MKTALELIVKSQELNSQYGWQSCFDVPEAYEAMETIAKQIQDELSHLDSYEKDVVTGILETIAMDVRNGNYDLETLELSYHTLDEYVEGYIMGSMDDSAREMFEKLFYFMDSHLRGQWVENNYLINDSNTYTSKWADIIISVHE